MAENNNNTPIRNDELLAAVHEMREAYKVFKEDENEENKRSFLDKNNRIINLALKATFLVPAVIKQNTQLVQDKQNHLKFQDKPQARFMLVKHKNGDTFFPIFTDKDEYDKMHSTEGYQTVRMKFGDIAQLTEQTPSVTGFVINPVSTNLPFTKDMLANIKQTIIKKVKEKEAAANGGSGITVSSGGADEE